MLFDELQSELKRSKRIKKNQLRGKRNPGFDRQQDGAIIVTMDEDVELSQSTLEGVQCECPSDSSTADASSQQDEQLDAFVVAAELASERQRADHGNQSNRK